MRREEKIIPKPQSVKEINIDVSKVKVKNKLKDLELTNIVIKDNGSLGFDVLKKDGRQVVFFSKVAERILLDWLLEKNKDNPDWVEINFERIKSQKGPWSKE